jgi:hypothetical protein
MNWTERMQEAADFLEAHAAERNGRGPTLAQLGAHLGGITRERARQIKLRIERYRRRPRHYDEHVRLWHRLRIEALPLPQAVRLSKTRAMVDNRRAIHRVLKGFAMLAGMQWKEDAIPSSLLAYPVKPKPNPEPPARRDIISAAEWAERAKQQQAAETRRQAERRRLAEEIRLEVAAMLAADPELRDLDRRWRATLRRDEQGMQG